MVRVFEILVLSFLAAVLTGCGEPEKSKPIWEDVKIGDIAPARPTKNSGFQLLKTANFDIYVFELPAKNIGSLDAIWELLEGSGFSKDGRAGYLYTRPLYFNDYEAFVGNTFVAGFGQLSMWDQVREQLVAAGGKKAETVSLLIPRDETKDLTVTLLEEEQTIFYVSSEGSMEGVTAGPGKLVLRIKAERIPGSRGVCKVDAWPVFLTPKKGVIHQLTPGKKSDEFAFTSAGFGLKMSLGDFVFLGPQEYIDHQITLGSLFFSRGGYRPVVRTFLLVCTRINY